MINQDNNSNNSKLPLPLQKVAKKIEILNTEGKIKIIDFKLNHSNLVNFKICSTRIFKFVFPYVFVAGAYIAATFSIGFRPFKSYYDKEYLNEKKEFDSLGNKRYEQQYEEFENNTNTISYVHKWKKAENGEYSRKVDVYMLNNVSEDKIYNILDGGNEASIDKLFGKSVCTKIEKRDNLTEDEINSEAYYQISVFSKDYNNYNLIKCDDEWNVLCTLLWLLGFGVLELGTYFINDYPFERPNRTILLVSGTKAIDISPKIPSRSDEINGKYPILDKWELWSSKIKLKTELRENEKQYKLLKGKNRINK